jgi:hypothetical protein
MSRYRVLVGYVGALPRALPPAPLACRWPGWGGCAWAVSLAPDEDCFAVLGLDAHSHGSPKLGEAIRLL